jgi:hypothetical protein
MMTMDGVLFAARRAVASFFRGAASNWIFFSFVPP